jgi:DNA (cytosine-5)-methyltransferase 1
MIHIYSFFSGIGLLDLGFENEGYENVFVNEVFAPFLHGYKYSRIKLQHTPPKFGYHLNSITDFLESPGKDVLKSYIHQSLKEKKIIGFIGGPPCPDFSIGGKNKGRKGEHGILSLHYINLIKENKPHFFLFENVKGLWRTNIHRKFYEELKNILRANGYLLTEKLVNAIQYGAPQDRERIMLVGIKRNFAKELDIEFDNNEMSLNGSFDWNCTAVYPDKKAFEYKWPTTTEYNYNSILKTPPNIPLELTVEHWFQKNNVINHVNAKHHFQPRAGLTRFNSIAEGDDSKKSFKRLHRWRYSPTAAYGNNEVHIHPYLPRRISVAEALAIQSLPPDFELPDDMTLTNMFKSIGNGVPYLLSRNIAKIIKNLLKR